MTSSVDINPFTAVDETYKVQTHADSHVGYLKKRQHRHVLKSKENTYKHKCNRLLKKKLKKYKLRQDGTEDPDVLDVSQILISSLVIKSPTNVKYPIVPKDESSCLEELRPKNYLFKMVRRKQAIKISNCVKSPNINIKQNEDFVLPEPISSQEKKHTNAFKLLMDSRNKSIGSNSPGKDRCDDHCESEEILQKKNTKAKRQLVLQKLAEAKGYLKNKEMDEIQNTIIKTKMDKRAERLKTMILKETKSTKDKNSQVKETGKQKLNLKDKVEVVNNNDLKKTPKAFKIIDIFNTLNDPIAVSPEKKHIPKEDKEFLEKLSPSLKKKESMLSYFKKVDKDPEPDNSDNVDGIIKVKLQLKTKKKGKKKKLSLKRDTNNVDELLEINDENNVTTSCPKESLPEPVSISNDVTEVISTGERQKRKRCSKLDKISTPDAEIIPLNNDSRPKRCIKRPVKYTDDAYLSSSDEDLQIFTPKKKKHVETVNNDVVVANSKSKPMISESVKPSVAKKLIKEANTPKKPVKLAPIFASKQLDAAALEAKQKFLQSGVPDQLKKIIQQQRNNRQLSCDFHVVVHVQQRESVVEDVHQPFLNVLSSDDDDVCPLTYEEDAFKKLINANETFHVTQNRENLKQSTQSILHNIKEVHPKFPVYRTYRYLRGKRKGEFKDCNINIDNSIEVMNDVVDVTIDSPDKLNWTDKYKAMSTNQIIGNFESIKELRKWLVSWTENQMKSKSRVSTGSDSSDYYQSDTDSRDSLKSMNNLLILTGPTGCGKTSSVYAVAAELAMKVIEVNASSRRTGKIMLQDLQEATQSHKVNRGTGIDNSQKSQEKGLTEALKKNKKRGRPKKSIDKLKKCSEKNEISSTPSSQESTRTDMSLILIDDADIIFDQDDGFTSAIAQLVQCSKRPVILITSSLMCPHLQRFIQNGKILKLYPLLPRLLGTWLDIMCVADSGIGWPGVGAKFLNYFKGDIRKTINYLQFYISSYANGVNDDEESASQNVDYYRTNIDDENSSLSWADDIESKKSMLPSNSNIDIQSHSMWTDYVDKHTNISKFRYPIQLFEIWWSVPRLLNIVPNTIAKVTNTCKSKESKGQTVKELEAIADALDAISLSDYISPVHPDERYDITAEPWFSAESDSVSELNNVDYYMNRYEIDHEVSHTLVAGCISEAQKVLNCDRKTDISFPGMSLHRQRDKIVARHKTLTSYLSPWAVLDRRSLALDYWSSCRTICRLEKCKTDSNVNMKRNNRFCHYLKSLNVLCKSDMFDNLCDSLANEAPDLCLSNIYE